jgi:hypothetical protein
MKAKFVITTKGKSFEDGLQKHPTEMLMLTKLVGVPLGAGPRAIDQLTNGLLTERMEAAGFNGQQATVVSIALGAGSAQKHIMLVGLGQALRFDQCTLAEAIAAAVTQAVKDGVSKLSIPVVGHRLLALRLNLRSTAHIVRQAAERTLAALPSDSRFEIEFICGPQAKRHLARGLAIPRRQKQGACCLSEPAA